jgi:hypothetical protein
LTLNAFILVQQADWILRFVKAGYKLGACRAPSRLVRIRDGTFTISNSAAIIPRSAPRVSAVARIQEYAVEISIDRRREFRRCSRDDSFHSTSIYFFA